MALGFIYAGQGSQKVGMGQDFYEKYPLFRDTMDNAETYVKNVTDFDVKELCFNGPMETLSQTKFTQPCMVSFAVGVTKLLKDAGIHPEYVCGLSLGEYSALYAADVLTQEDVINLVAFRGKAMEEAVTGREVKMSAVLAMERDVILQCCKEAEEALADECVVINGEMTSEKYTVQVANYNCPGQIVISGDGKAVDKATELLKEKGAKRVMPLAVSGPFHTSLMKPAGDKLKERFETVDFRKAQATVVFNAIGKPMNECDCVKADGEKLTDSDCIKVLLEKQVQSSVYLEDSIKYLADNGVDTIVEIGPGNTISKFIKKTAPEIKVYSIDKAEDLETVIAELG